MFFVPNRFGVISALIKILLSVKFNPVTGLKPQFFFSIIDQSVMDLDWEIYLKQTAQAILQEQTPRKLMEVRSRIYELLTHCIPPDAIFVGLTKVRFSKISSNHVKI